jgi:hypothetical protein
VACCLKWSKQHYKTLLFKGPTWPKRVNARLNVSILAEIALPISPYKIL